MKFLSILKRASGETTSAELRAALGEIDLVQAEREVAKIEAEYRQVLLNGTEKEIEEIERRITEGNRDVVRKSAAIEALTARIADAETRELAAFVSSKVDECHVEAQQIKDAVSAIHQHATRLAEALHAYQAHNDAFNAAKSFVHSNGGSEGPRHPMGLLYELTGGKLSIREPLNVFVLPGYFPSSAPESYFDRMKEVDLLANGY